MRKLDPQEPVGPQAPAVGTLLAVVLGVAFLAGTLVLGDTLRSSFDDLFADATAGTDVVVRNATEVEPASPMRGAARSTRRSSSSVRTVDGVADAEPVDRGLRPDPRRRRRGDRRQRPAAPPAAGSTTAT